MPGGRLDIWQQEPSPDGASEICVFDCCACIIGQCSPPQWPAIAAFALQLARAVSGVANNSSARLAAASLLNRFTEYVLILRSAVLPGL